jgi:hypothetical protein
MAGKIKTWIWVVVSLVVICVIGVVAVAGMGYYFVTKHFDTKVTSPATARLEFEQIKKQFTDQKPLIELDERGRFLRAHPDRPVRPETRRPVQLYVLAFDPDDERIVKVTIPFWLLRLKARGTIDFNGGHLELEDLKLTVEDLERFGPTLIVDHQSSGGERVLVWSQ